MIHQNRVVEDVLSSSWGHVSSELKIILFLSFSFMFQTCFCLIQCCAWNLSKVWSFGQMKIKHQKLFEETLVDRLIGRLLGWERSKGGPIEMGRCHINRDRDPERERDTFIFIYLYCIHKHR